MERFHPTVRQLCIATLAGIHNHPRIQQPGIYYPLLNSQGKQTEVFIERWRTYSGYELEEGLLTCSVSPAFNSRSIRKGSPSTREAGKSVSFSPYALGHSNGGSNDPYQQATYRLAIDLQYRDVAIGEQATVEYSSVDTPFPNYYQQAFQSTYSPPGANPEDSLTLGLNKEHDRIIKKKFQVEINPAEEMLREYLDLIRMVLNDMRTLTPYTVRSTEVISMDFPTSSWTENSDNLIFHLAYIIWEVVLYPPASWQTFQSINAIQIATD